LGGPFRRRLNPAIKLFFDNTLSKRLPKVVHAVYSDEYPDLSLKHLTDYFSADDQDEDWLPLLEAEKDWIVITSDRGTDPKKEKLPILCTKLQITHVSITNAMHRAGYSTHKHALLSLFHQFACLSLLPRGTRVVLGFRAYHKRNWPYLLVNGHPLDSWCIENNISLPGIMISN
jgi:hypothetical protein